MSDTTAAAFAATEDAQRRADELRAEADRLEGQAFTDAARLRAEADALDVSTWPRLVVRTRDHDPEQVARVEAIANETGVVIASRRVATVYVDEAGNLAQGDAEVPIESRVGVVARSVYELELAAPDSTTLADLSQRAVVVGLVWPERSAAETP